MFLAVLPRRWTHFEVRVGGWRVRGLTKLGRVVSACEHPIFHGGILAAAVLRRAGQLAQRHLPRGWLYVQRTIAASDGPLVVWDRTRLGRALQRTAEFQAWCGADD